MVAGATAPATIKNSHESDKYLPDQVARFQADQDVLEAVRQAVSHPP